MLVASSSMHGVEDYCSLGVGETTLHMTLIDWETVCCCGPMDGRRRGDFTSMELGPRSGLLRFMSDFILPPIITESAALPKRLMRPCEVGVGACEEEADTTVTVDGGSRMGG